MAGMRKQSLSETIRHPCWEEVSLRTRVGSGGSGPNRYAEKDTENTKVFRRAIG